MSEQAPQRVKPGKARVVYAHQFYEALSQNATTEEVEGVPLNVYRGKLMELFKSLGVGTNYYTPIRSMLLQSGSIEYLQRGTRAYDSVVVLHHPPPDDFTFEGLTDGPDGDTLEELGERLEALENLRDKLGGLDIKEALVVMERRIRQLEERVNATST